MDIGCELEKPGWLSEGCVNAECPIRTERHGTGAPNNLSLGGESVMPRGPAHVARLAIQNARKVVNAVIDLAREVSGLNVQVRP